VGCVQPVSSRGERFQRNAFFVVVPRPGKQLIIDRAEVQTGAEHYLGDY
jgi:hypothetical protein